MYTVKIRTRVRTREEGGLEGGVGGAKRTWEGGARAEGRRGSRHGGSGLACAAVASATGTPHDAANASSGAPPCLCCYACLAMQTVAERAALEEEEEQVVVKDKQRKEQRKVRDRGARDEEGCYWDVCLARHTAGNWGGGGGGGVGTAGRRRRHAGIEARSVLGRGKWARARITTVKG